MSSAPPDLGPDRSATRLPSAPASQLVASAARTVVVGYALTAAVLLLAGAALMHLGAPVRHWDEHVNTWFAARRTRDWNRVTADGTFAADTLGVVTIAALVTALGVVRRWGRAAALLAVALAVELAVFLTVNYVVARPRPAAPHLGSTPSTYSFPSGHVGATLALYGGIAILVEIRTGSAAGRRLAWAVAGLMVGWVAVSRVYEGQHHPTDVLAGLALGCAALAVGTAALRLVPDDRSPITGGDGGRVTWSGSEQAR